MNNDKITKKQEQQLIEMLEIMEDTVEYFWIRTQYQEKLHGTW